MSCSPAFCLEAWPPFKQGGTDQRTVKVLPSTELAAVEIRLAYETHGGCFGRCVAYLVVIRGDGTVQYQDLGSEPRERVRQRWLPVDDVVAILSEFARERFFDFRASYDSMPMARRDGNSIHFQELTGFDGEEWNLTLRVGIQVKTTRLFLAAPTGMPTSVARLCDLVLSMGGPKAWDGK